jgi:hypothetical protein
MVGGNDSIWIREATGLAPTMDTPFDLSAAEYFEARLRSVGEFHDAVRECSTYITPHLVIANEIAYKTRNFQGHKLSSQKCMANP